MFPVHAQDRLKNLEFKQFSTPDGLPNSMVHQVYQDRTVTSGFPPSMDYSGMMVMKSEHINQIFTLRDY